VKKIIDADAVVIAFGFRQVLLHGSENSMFSMMMVPCGSAWLMVVVGFFRPLTEIFAGGLYGAWFRFSR